MTRERSGGGPLPKWGQRRLTVPHTKQNTNPDIEPWVAGGALAPKGAIFCGPKKVATAQDDDVAKLIVDRVNGGPRKIEVDIGATMRALQADPSLGDKIMAALSPQLAASMEAADDLITELAAALRAMTAEFRAHDLPYGSAAYVAANQALAKVPAGQPTKVTA
jgi:hypothetical protein